jgi:hypothetical protein
MAQETSLPLLQVAMLDAATAGLATRFVDAAPTLAIDEATSVVEVKVIARSCFFFLSSLEQQLRVARYPLRVAPVFQRAPACRHP